MITQAYLKSLLDYDPLSGLFTWAVGRKGTRKGAVAGCVGPDGYVIIMVDKKNYPAHRLAFIWMLGEMPANDVDHINRVRADNRWSNLRPATRRENNLNSGVRSNNTSGYKNVSHCSRTGKFTVSFRVGGKTRFFGRFKTAEAANREAIRLRKILCGDFARDK